MLAALAFGAYALTAAPTAYWLDSSELAAGAFELGITHPPGHPLFVMAGKLATLLPLGPIAWRVHLMCSMMLAGAMAMLAPLMRWLLRDRATALSAALAVLLLAAQTPVWFHGVRAEVYPLHLALACGILWQGLRIHHEPTPARAWGLAFLVGLAATNHHYLTVFLVVPLGVWLLCRREVRGLLWRQAPACLLLAAYGLLVYAELPLRAGDFTTVRWGDPTSPSGLWWMLTAEAFQKTAGRVGAADPLETAGHVFQFFREGAGLIVLVLAGLGLLALLWRRWPVALLLVACLVFNVASQVLFDFDPTNPDVGGYFLLSLVIVTLLAGVALTEAWWLAQRGSTLLLWVGRSAVVAVALLAAVVCAGAAQERCNLRDFRDPDVFAQAAWHPVPSGGTLVTSYFETIFNMWYRDVAECRRPDARLVHRLFRTYPGYDDFLRNRYPDMAAALAVDPGSGQLDRAWLLTQAAQLGVVMEGDPTADSALVPYLLPAGLMLRLAPTPVPGEAAPEWLLTAQRQFWESLYPMVHRQNRETVGNLLWAHFNLARVWNLQGQITAAQNEWDLASALAPGDPMLDTMRPLSPTP